MSRLIKTMGILTLLFIFAGMAQAEWCLNYSSWLRSQNPKLGLSGCVSSKSACEAEKNAHSNWYSGICYQRGGGSDEGGKGSADAQKAKAQADAIASQQKYEQQKIAEKKAQESAYSAMQKKLLSDLKGDVALSKPNNIDLKMPPEKSAAGQLGLLEREGHQAVAKGKHNDENHSNWENPVKNLPAAMIPKVPEVPQPTPVETESKAKQAQVLLGDLLGRIKESRREVDKLDREVTQLEETVAREETKAQVEKKPDDDALRKAREALQRAKENRKKTIAELNRLEEQEKAVRSEMQNAANEKP